MPHLSVFVACDKIIIDQSGVASLITLFGTITISLPPEAPELPVNAIVPKEWAVFTMWEWEPGDEKKKFMQHLEMRWPDGSVFLEKKDEIVKVPEKRMTQIVSPIAGFPVGQPGMIALNVSLESDGTTVFKARPIFVEVVHGPV